MRWAGHVAHMGDETGEKLTGFWLESMKERDCKEYLGLVRRRMIKLIFKK
jgi:hypothetical protein